MNKMKLLLNTLCIIFLTTTVNLHSLEEEKPEKNNLDPQSVLDLLLAEEPENIDINTGIEYAFAEGKQKEYILKNIKISVKIDEAKKTFVCQCNDNGSLESLNEHLFSHVSDENKIECEVCDPYTYHYPRKLLDHQLKRHSATGQHVTGLDQGIFALGKDVDVKTSSQEDKKGDEHDLAQVLAGIKEAPSRIEHDAALALSGIEAAEKERKEKLKKYEDFAGEEFEFNIGRKIIKIKKDHKNKLFLCRECFVKGVLEECESHIKIHILDRNNENKQEAINKTKQVAKKSGTSSSKNAAKKGEEGKEEKEKNEDSSSDSGHSESETGEYEPSQEESSGDESEDNDGQEDLDSLSDKEEKVKGKKRRSSGNKNSVGEGESKEEKKEDKDKKKKFNCTGQRSTNGRVLTCEFSTNNPTDFKKHQQYHDPNNEFPCDHCSMSFTKKNGRAKHTGKVHSEKLEKLPNYVKRKNGLWICGCGNFLARTATEIRNHIVIHDPKNGDFECKEKECCRPYKPKLYFKNQSALTRHCKKFHSPAKLGAVKRTAQIAHKANKALTINQDVRQLTNSKVAIKSVSTSLLSKESKQTTTSSSTQNAAESITSFGIQKDQAPNKTARKKRRIVISDDDNSDSEKRKSENEDKKEDEENKDGKEGKEEKRVTEDSSSDSRPSESETSEYEPREEESSGDASEDVDDQEDEDFSDKEEKAVKGKKRSSVNKNSGEGESKEEKKEDKKKEKRFKCIEKRDTNDIVLTCKFSARKPVELKKHIKNFHDPKNEYLCDRCSMSFPEKNGRAIHKAIVHKLGQGLPDYISKEHGLYICRCGFYSPEISNIKKHICIHDPSNGKECPNCEDPKSFLRKGWNRHYTMYHSPNKIFHYNRFPAESLLGKNKDEVANQETKESGIGQLQLLRSSTSPKSATLVSIASSLATTGSQDAITTSAASAQSSPENSVDSSDEAANKAKKRRIVISDDENSDSEKKKSEDKKKFEDKKEDEENKEESLVRGVNVTTTTITEQPDDQQPENTPNIDLRANKTIEAPSKVQEEQADLSKEAKGKKFKKKVLYTVVNNRDKRIGRIVSYKIKNNMGDGYQKVKITLLYKYAKLYIYRCRECKHCDYYEDLDNHLELHQGTKKHQEIPPENALKNASLEDKATLDLIDKMYEKYLKDQKMDEQKKKTKSADKKSKESTIDQDQPLKSSISQESGVSRLSHSSAIISPQSTMKVSIASSLPTTGSQAAITTSAASAQSIPESSIVDSQDEAANKAKKRRIEISDDENYVENVENKSGEEKAVSAGPKSGAAKEKSSVAKKKADEEEKESNEKKVNSDLIELIKNRKSNATHIQEFIDRNLNQLPKIINSKNKEGRTPLMQASISGKPEIIKLLKLYGATEGLYNFGKLINSAKYLVLTGYADVLDGDIYPCRVLYQKGARCGLHAIINGILEILQIQAARKDAIKTYDKFEKIITIKSKEFENIFGSFDELLKKFRAQARYQKEKTDLMSADELKYLVGKIKEVLEHCGIEAKVTSENLTVISDINELSNVANFAAWSLEDTYSIAKQIIDSKINPNYIHSFALAVNGMKHWINVTVFKDNKGKLVYLEMDSINGQNRPEVKVLKALLESDGKVYIENIIEKFNSPKDNLYQMIKDFQKGQLNETRSLKYALKSLKIVTYNKFIESMVNVLFDAKKMEELFIKAHGDKQTYIKFDVIKNQIIGEILAIPEEIINQFFKGSQECFEAILKLLTELTNLSEFRKGILDLKAKDGLADVIKTNIEKDKEISSILNRNGLKIDDLLANINMAVIKKTFKTLLMIAAQKGDSELLKNLLEYGTNPFVEIQEDKSNQEKLFQETELRHEEDREFLVDGWTALDFAVITGNKECAKIIMKYAIANQEDSIGFMRTKDIKTINEILEDRKGSNALEDLKFVFEMAVATACFKLVKMIFAYDPTFTKFAERAIPTAGRILDSNKREKTIEVLENARNEFRMANSVTAGSSLPSSVSKAATVSKASTSPATSTAAVMSAVATVNINSGSGSSELSSGNSVGSITPTLPTKASTISAPSIPTSSSGLSSGSSAVLSTSNLPIAGSAASIQTSSSSELSSESSGTINRLETSDNKALFEAYEMGSLQSFIKLLDEGADINAKDKEGNSLLILAAKSGDCLSASYFLIKKGANINIKDRDGNTALIHAAKNKNNEIMLLLLRLKADQTIKNNDGNNFSWFLKGKEFADIILAALRASPPKFESDDFTKLYEDWLSRKTSSGLPIEQTDRGASTSESSSSAPVASSIPNTISPSISMHTLPIPAPVPQMPISAPSVSATTPEPNGTDGSGNGNEGEESVIKSGEKKAISAASKFETSEEKSSEEKKKAEEKDDEGKEEKKDRGSSIDSKPAESSQSESNGDKPNEDSISGSEEENKAKKNKFQCMDCKATFVSMKGLSIHIGHLHTELPNYVRKNDKFYICDCGTYCSKYKKDMNIHSRIHNPKNGDWQCIECKNPKSYFKNQEELTDHLIIHSSIPKFTIPETTNSSSANIAKEEGKVPDKVKKRRIESKSEYLTVISNINELSNVANFAAWSSEDAYSIARQIIYSAKEPNYIHSFELAVNGMTHWINVKVFRDKGKLVYIEMDSINEQDRPEIRMLRNILESDGECYFKKVIETFDAKKDNLYQMIKDFQKGHLNNTSFKNALKSLKIRTFNKFIEDIVQLLSEAKKIEELMIKAIDDKQTAIKFELIKDKIIKAIQAIPPDITNQFFKGSEDRFAYILRLLTELTDLSKFRTAIFSLKEKDKLADAIKTKIKKDKKISGILNKNGLKIDAVLANINMEVVKTLLMITAREGKIELLKYLLEFGADPFGEENQEDKSNQELLCQNAERKEESKEQKEEKEDREFLVHGGTALNFAMSTGNKECAKIIMKYAIANQEDSIGFMQTNDIKSISEILEDREKSTASKDLEFIFAMAVATGSYKLVKMIFAYDPTFTQHAKVAIDIAGRIIDEEKRKKTIEVLEKAQNEFSAKTAGSSLPSSVSTAATALKVLSSPAAPTTVTSAAVSPI